MKIAIGCDHAAYNEKNKLIEYLENKNIEIFDLGCNSEDSVDYPDYAHMVCNHKSDYLLFLILYMS